MKRRGTRRRRPWWRAFARLVVFLVLMAVLARAAWWNEHESPWGARMQAAKTEKLRAQLCGER